MKKGFYTIMAAQFFSSLADNALFIAAIALIEQLHGPEWMKPMTKWSFALAYVLLAAFVGAIADAYPKGKVMFFTNMVKIMGCTLMFFFARAQIDSGIAVYLVCATYALVGIGAAAYSPAKYGIITELLPPDQLVKGNGWIEGLTVISIILGFVLGSQLINPDVSAWLLSQPIITQHALGAESPAEAAILVIAFIYLIATVLNWVIPKTNYVYPAQSTNPAALLRDFYGFFVTLWKDKVGQISLTVTTLFWGAGATLQLIVLEWGKAQLGLSLDKASILMGITSVGTIAGAILAGKIIPLKKSLVVLPVGVLMGLTVMVLPFAYEPWFVYTLLIIIGGLGGFFVVPMNALLQHRGHVLLSAGHSIAVQNFNEQLNILLMVASYSLMLKLEFPINTIMWLFGAIVAALMLVVMIWYKRNAKRHPDYFNEIGTEKSGVALAQD